MDLVFNITEIYVFPAIGEYTNVVGKVIWKYYAEQDEVRAFGAGETLLNVDNIENFVDIESLTEDDIIDWVIATEGGEAFKAALRTNLQPIIDQLIREKGLVAYVGLNKA